MTMSAVKRVNARSTSNTTKRFNKTKPKGPTIHHTPTDQHKMSCPGCGSTKGHTSRTQLGVNSVTSVLKTITSHQCTAGGTPPSAQHQSATQHQSTAQPTARSYFVRYHLTQQHTYAEDLFRQYHQTARPLCGECRVRRPDLRSHITRGAR